MHRRTVPSDIMLSDERDVEVSSVRNPIHTSLFSSSGPSQAYLESMRRAKASNEHSYIDDRRLAQKKYGWKTKCVAFTMFLIGWVMFIIGCVFYFNSKSGQQSTGFDILLTGSIMVVPGTYAVWIIIGVGQGWNGYSFQQLPSFD